ncbi:MAG: energy-coupling factor transporter transmembrane protein EcfT [Treponema sp.]|jgi:cobalt/nickel transport system permease protein|nr:energy-coupling factor transporter transmembrane protein EcfT [Treponema sp.]
MYLDRLEYKKDLLKSFDGRCRLLSAASVIISVVNITNTVLLGGVILASLCVLLREFRVTIQRLIPVNMMAFALWIPVIAGFNPYMALLYTLRINCAALVYMSFVAPMSISVLASSMSALKAPEKLVSLFVLTYRYIFLLYEGLAMALVSMRSRLVKHNIVYQWHSMAAVFAATLTRAAFRAEKVWIAMSSRGFGGSFPIIISFKWRIRDSVLLSISAVFFVVVVWII